MVERLVIHDGELRGAIESIRASRVEFGSAVSRTDVLQQAVGHRGLSQALHGFESSWSLRRAKLVVSMERLEKQLQGVLDAFGEWDAGNAAGATGAPGAGSQSPQPVAAAAAPSSAPAAVPAAVPGAVPAAPAPLRMLDPDDIYSTMPVDLPEHAPEPDSVPVEEWTPAPDSPETEPHGAGPLPDLELPGSPEAVNALLERLERLADGPAGIAALAGAMGALALLAALFPAGSSVAPGLAGVDGERVRRLITRAGEGGDPFAGFTPTPPVPEQPPADAVGELLDDLEPLPSSIEDASEQPRDDEGDNERAEPPTHSTSGSAPDTGDEPSPPHDATGSPASEAPAAPVAPAAASAPSASSAALADVPHPADPPAPAHSTGLVSNAALDASFPLSSAEVGHPAVSPTSTDVGATLDALAEADPGPDESPAARPPMGMPGMAAAGMASTVAASTAQTAASSGAGGRNGDPSDTERVVAARRQLDDLPAPTKDKDLP